MAKRKGLRRQLSQMAASGQALEQQIQDLIDQDKYATAIRKLQQGLKRDPDQTLKTNEADIWLLRGKHEFEQARYTQAINALQQALDLGLRDDTYYWLAKCLLAQEKTAEALNLFQAAFEDKTLPKKMGGCYLKLLFLNDQTDEVERLIKTQTKRFYAPQLRWARGAIALKANNLTDALAQFKTMGKPVSPGDQPIVWQAYSHQQRGDWAAAEDDLATVWPGSRLNFFQRQQPPQSPAIHRLVTAQVAHTGRGPVDFSYLEKVNQQSASANWVLEFLNFIFKDNVHDAAHLFLDFPDEVIAQYPELQALYRPLMLAAGSQSFQQGEIGCVADFWSHALKDQSDFDPNLALNLYQAMELSGEYDEAQQQLTQIVNWVKRDARQNPQKWPAAKLNPTLAKLYCWSTDCLMSLGRYREVKRLLQEAEKLSPEHPEVLGRKGLDILARHGDPDEAMPLLRQALEGGCEFEEVYGMLVRSLADDPDEVKAIRRKFGQKFGDADVNTEIELPDWVEALTFQHYEMMSEFVEDHSRPSPALKAFSIFLAAADDAPSSGQKITLNQKQAVPQWEALLASHSPAEQVEIIEAIYLIVQQHSKRNQKGIAALQKSYVKKIAALSSQQVPGADVAYLVILATASPAPGEITPTIEPILNLAIQPADVLATAQLALRYFGRNRALLPLIEAYAKKETQNPKLLLARATLHPRGSREYETFYDKGFEIARRLQDAEALQAFREEDWLEAQALTRRVVGPQMDFLGDPSQIDIADMIQRMAREAFGEKVPPEILARMMPEIEAELSDDGGFFADDPFDDSIDPFSFPPPRRSGKKSSRRKSSKKRKY
ncbi:MAG: tetratricopeptide repeat protein [Phormidesmis sp.]